MKNYKRNVIINQYGDNISSIVLIQQGVLQNIIKTLTFVHICMYVCDAYIQQKYNGLIKKLGQNKKLPNKHICLLEMRY